MIQRYYCGSEPGEYPGYPDRARMIPERDGDYILYADHIAHVVKLEAILRKMVNDDAFAELCQGIGEEPSWLKDARAVLLKPVDERVEEILEQARVDTRPIRQLEGGDGYHCVDCKRPLEFCKCRASNAATAEVAKLKEALRGLLDRHRDGSEEQYWAEWDTAIDALKGN